MYSIKYKKTLNKLNGKPGFLLVSRNDESIWSFAVPVSPHPGVHNRLVKGLAVPNLTH